MIDILINKINYEVPTSWYDVTYKQWNEIQSEKDELRMLSIITNIPIELLTNFNQKQLDKIGIVLNFLQVPIKFSDVSKPNNPIDIKRQSWGKRIEAEQVLRNKADDINGIIKCYELDVNCPIVEVFEMVLDIIEQLKLIIEKESKELHVEQTREQIMAGTSMYDEFGVMNSIRAVALGNILNFDRVLEIEYNVVFMYLKMSKTDTVFQKNYQKVLSKK